MSSKVKTRNISQLFPQLVISFHVDPPLPIAGPSTSTDGSSFSVLAKESKKYLQSGSEESTHKQYQTNVPVGLCESERPANKLQKQVNKQNPNLKTHSCQHIYEQVVAKAF